MILDNITLQTSYLSLDEEFYNLVDPEPLDEPARDAECPGNRRQVVGRKPVGIIDFGFFRFYFAAGIFSGETDH